MAVGRKPKYVSEEERQKAWKEAKRRYEDRDKEIIAAKKAVWYADNKERLGVVRKEDRKRHYNLNRAKCIEYVMRRAGKIREAEDRLSLAERVEIQSIYDFCKIFPNFEVDHIVPLSGKIVSGLHVPCNLQALLVSENRSKYNKFDPEAIA